MKLSGLLSVAARRWKASVAACVMLGLVGSALITVSTVAIAQSTPVPANPLPALPSVLIVKGALITPAAADQWYNSQITTQVSTDGLCARYSGNPDICPTSGRPRAPEVRELARALKHDPDLIYEYVRNGIDTEFLFGSHKGSLGVIIDKSGTAFDQAQLMVDLLRETREDGSPGHNARFRYGTLSLTGAEFAAWTGITNAKAACDFLATGGVPAQIDNCSDTGTVSSVTLSHVWVEAEIDGAWRFFDPSYKPYEHTRGINNPAVANNIKAAMGFASGEVATAAGGSTNTTGTTGLTNISGFSASGLNNKLQAYSQGLLTRLQQSDMEGASLREVIGGRLIVPAVRTTVNWLQSQPANYASSTTWAKIPDPWRARLELDADVPNSSTVYIDATFFADEIYGRTLELLSTPTGEASSTETWRPQLLFDGVALDIGAQLSGPLRQNINLRIKADHPFAAAVTSGAPADGQYADREVTKRLEALTAASLVVAWGSTSPDLASRWRAEHGADRPRYATVTIPLEDPGEPIPSGDGLRAQIGATWLAQFSWAANINAELANSRPVMLHTLGVISEDQNLARVPETPWMPDQVTGGDPYGFETYDEITVVDLETSYGLVSRTSNASERLGAVHAIAATAATLEGSVIAQLVDSPDSASTSARFAWGVSPEQSEDPASAFLQSPRPFYYVSGATTSERSASANAFVGLTTYDGGTSSVPAYNNVPVISQSTVDTMRGKLSGTVQAYAAADYDIAVSAESSLGPGHRIGTEYGQFQYSVTRPGGGFTARTGCYAGETSYRKTSKTNIPPGVDPSQFPNSSDDSESVMVPVFNCTMLNGESGHLEVEHEGGDYSAATITRVRTAFARMPTLQRGGALLATKYESASSNEPVAIANVLTRYGHPTKGGGGPSVTQAMEFIPNEAGQALKDRFVDRSGALGVDLGKGQAGFTSPVLASVGSGEFPYRLDRRIDLRGGAIQYILEPTPGSAPSRPAEGLVSNWDVRAEVSNSGFETMGQSRIQAAVPTIVAFIAMQDVWANQPKGGRRDIIGTLTADWWSKRLLFNVATILQGASAQQFVRLIDGSFIPANGGAGKLTMTGDRVVKRPNIQRQKVMGATQVESTLRGWDYSGVSQIEVTNPNGDKQNFQYWTAGKPNTGRSGEVYLDIDHGWRLNTWTFPQGVTLSLAYNSSNMGSSYVGAQSSVPSRVNSSLGFGLDIPQIAPAEAPQTVSPLAGCGILEATNLAGEKTKLVFRKMLERTVNQRPDGACRPLEVYAPSDQNTPSLSYTYDSLGRVKEARDAIAIREPLTRGPHKYYVAEGYRGERVDPLGGRYAVETVRGGRETRHIDELGRTTTTSVDGRGRVLERTFPEGDKVRFTYDARDNPATLTKCPKAGCGTGLDLTVSAQWHPDWNKPTSITDAMGRTTTFAYWESGDGKSLLKTAVRPSPSGGASQPTYSFWYNSVGLLWKTTDADGYLTENSWSSTGCLLSTRLGPVSLNLTKFFACDAVGNTTEAWDARGETLTKVTTAYDLMRRPTQVTAPLGAVTKTVYDLDGRPTEVQKRLLTGTTESWQLWKTAYTATGQTAWTLDPSGDLATFEYDALDRKVKATAPTGDISGWVYDAAGQLLQVKEGVGIACGAGVACEQARETWSYTLNGQKEGLWDARGNLTCFYYDGHDRLLATEFPDLSKEGSATALPARVQVAGQPTRCATSKTAAMLSQDPGQYDLAGNVLKFRNREGAYIARTYDALDRLSTEKGLWTDGITPGHASSRSWRMRDATFSYWLSGRMISAATDQVTKAWTYEPGTGRPLTHTASTPAPNAASYSFTYGWDVAGNLTSVGYPTTVGISGIPNPGTLTATYAYDALNRMTGVTTTGIKAASASLTYDTLSRRKSVTFGDNSTQAYDYEADDDLSSIAHTFVTAPATHNVTLTYSNDKLGRQVSETTSNSLYLYDPPLAATGPYGAATSLNQYPTVGSTTYSYAPNDLALLPSGSVTSDGVRAFFYDEKGNLTKARQGADSANNFDQDSFDALGVRWYSYRSAPAATDTSRIELTDGLRPEVAFELHSTVAEGGTTPVAAGAYYSVLGPNPDERLIWINGTEASLKARYPHTNRRGDTIAMGRDGIVETKFKYGPFGESADSTAGYPWRFTGQRLNGWTGLYHFKARAYAPGIGRFLQPDPIGYGDGPNIYRYCKDDPFNCADPTGMEAWRTETVAKREDGTEVKTVTIHFTATLVNDGGAPNRPLLVLATVLEMQFEESFTASETDANGNTINYVAVADITIGSPEAGRHVIHILPDGHAIRGPGVAGSAQAYQNDIYISDGVMSGKYLGSFRRTGAHEIGHSLGLYHPDEQRGFTPPEENLMSQTGKSQSFTIILEQMQFISENTRRK